MCLDGSCTTAPSTGFSETQIPEPYPGSKSVSRHTPLRWFGSTGSLENLYHATLSFTARISHLPFSPIHSSSLSDLPHHQKGSLWGFNNNLHTDNPTGTSSSRFVQSLEPGEPSWSPFYLFSHPSVFFGNSPLPSLYMLRVPGAHAVHLLLPLCSFPWGSGHLLGSTPKFTSPAQASLLSTTPSHSRLSKFQSVTELFHKGPTKIHISYIKRGYKKRLKKDFLKRSKKVICTTDFLKRILIQDC